MEHVIAKRAYKWFGSAAALAVRVCGGEGGVYFLEEAISLKVNLYSKSVNDLKSCHSAHTGYLALYSVF